MLYSTLDSFDNKIEFQLHDVVNLLNIFNIFESIREHNSIDGTISSIHLAQALNNNVGPYQLFTVVDQDKTFTIN